MPTFNSAEFLEDALASLNRQSHQNFELIICDGGSTDGTLDIVARVMGRRAKIVSKSDSGVPDALNKGFSASEGNVLCWLNSDDVLISSNALSRVHSHFLAHHFDVAIADSVNLDSDGVVSKTLISFAPPMHAPWFKSNLFTGSLFFSREAWRFFGGFSESYRIAFEYELTDCIFSRFRVNKINHVIGGFRVHSSGLSSTFGSLMTAEVKALRPALSHFKSRLQKMHRLRKHIEDRRLLRVIQNALHDPNRGLNWYDVERVGWVGEL